MGKFKVLGLPDIFSTAGAEIIAASETATMGDELMLTEEPSEFWRSSSNAPNKTNFRGKISGNHSFAVSGMGVVATNLWRATGRVRFFALSTDLDTFFNQAFEDIVATTLVDKVNTTAVAADIDAGFTPSGTWAQPTTPGVAWSFRAEIETPAATPRTGAAYQSLWIFAKATVAESIQTAPTIRCRLYLNGVETAELGTKSITSATGQWIYFPWTFTGTMAAADIEFRCDMAPGESGTDAYVGELVGHMEEDGVSSEGDLLHDSGWLPLGQVADHPGESTSYVAEEIDLQTSKLHDIGSTLSTAKCLWVFIEEDHAPNHGTDGYPIASLNATPFGFVEVGKFVAGLVFTPTYSISFGDYLGIRDLSTEVEDEHGQESGSCRGTQRYATINLETLTPAEWTFIAERWVRKRGVLGPVLVCLNHGDTTEEAITTFYATLAGAENVTGADWKSGHKRRTQLPIEEKL